MDDANCGRWRQEQNWPLPPATSYHFSVLPLVNYELPEDRTGSRSCLCPQMPEANVGELAVVEGRK